MWKRVINWLIGLTCTALVIGLLGVIMKAEQDDKRKCKEAGMVYVKPHRGEAYCAAGKSLNDLGN